MLYYPKKKSSNIVLLDFYSQETSSIIGVYLEWILLYAVWKWMNYVF